MLIYLDEYRPARAATASVLKNGTYGDEIMHANWNPTVVYLFKDAAQRALSPELPFDLATVDVDEFMDRVYALATQI